MSRDLLLTEVLALPIEDRLDFYKAIGDSLGPEITDEPLPEEWKAIILQRLKEHDDDPASSIPAEQVYEELEREL